MTSGIVKDTLINHEGVNSVTDTKQSSSGKESVIRVLKANPDKPMTVREVHDYMLAKNYKMCGVATIATAFKSLRKDQFLEIQDADGRPHVKSTEPKGRRQMYAVWHPEQKTADAPAIPATRKKTTPMHQSFSAAQDDVDIEELCDNAPNHVTRALLWLKLHDYDILLVKK